MPISPVQILPLNKQTAASVKYSKATTPARAIGNLGDENVSPPCAFAAGRVPDHEGQRTEKQHRGSDPDAYALDLEYEELLLAKKALPPPQPVSTLSAGSLAR